MEYLEGILRITDDELGAVVKNGKYRNREEIDSVYKLIDIAKDVYCIWKYEDGEDMSYDGDSYAMRHDSSYARGRGSGAKRYADGRYAPYSRDGDRGYRGYSRDSHDDYLTRLKDMMDSAPDDQTRQSIHRMIQQIEQG